MAEANTSHRTPVRVAASTLLIPHWVALAKALAGASMLVYAAIDAGVSPATVGLLPEALLIAVCVIAFSLALARPGVARPDLDVIFLVLRRPGRPDRHLPGISIAGMSAQLLLNVGTFPVVKLLPPSVLYQPEIAPSRGLLLVSLAVAALLSLVAALVWRGRLAWRAPHEQQREAEEFA